MRTTANFTRHQLSILLEDINSNAFKCRAGIFVVCCKRIVEFCNRNSLVNEILKNVEAVSVDYTTWKTTCAFGEDGFSPYWGYEQDVHICWKAIQEIAGIHDAKSTKILQELSAIGSFRDRDEPPRIVLNRYIVPLFQYLIENLDAQQLVINNLQRFIQRCQQFDKDILYSRYQNDVQQGTYKGEFHLDRELRRYLFDQGINTLSSPHSGTGRVDIVSFDPEPLAIEVKIFCPNKTYPNGFEQKSNYGETYLKQGFNQLHQAVVSYGSTYGVLFVFNLSNENISFDTGSASSPQALVLNNKTYYLLHVNLYPHSSDSKATRPPRVINANDWLVSMENTGAQE